MGIRIMPPDVNESRWDFTVVEAHERDTVKPGSTIGSIRFGLAPSRTSASPPIEAMIEAGKQRAPLPLCGVQQEQGPAQGEPPRSSKHSSNAGHSISPGPAAPG